MGDALFWHRLQFAFTAVYHYIFPQLTMGLAFLIVVMKFMAIRRNDSRWDDAARFWIRIFGLNFAVGVVTGVPMEFQFGTNWARFSEYAGKVVGHTLGMEGLFAFFLESGFIAILIWGERRVGRRGHFLAAIALGWGAGFPGTLSWPPMRSCSGRWGTRSPRMERCASRVSPPSCSIRGPSRSTRTPSSRRW